MITKNFKNVLALLLQTYSGKGYLESKDINGTTYYMAPKVEYVFPNAVGRDVNINSDTSSTGILLGTGNTPPTENDYALESRITSGLSASTPVISFGLDNDGNPMIVYDFTLTNTSGADITVREVGYAQKRIGATSRGGNGSTTMYLLFDRTVLSNPVTVPANGYAAMRYTLKTVLPS